MCHQCGARYGDEQAEKQVHLWGQVARYLLVGALAPARAMAYESMQPPHQRPAAVTVWLAVALRSIPHQHVTRRLPKVCIANAKWDRTCKEAYYLISEQMSAECCFAALTSTQ